MNVAFQRSKTLRSKRFVANFCAFLFWNTITDSNAPQVVTSIFLALVKAHRIYFNFMKSITKLLKIMQQKSNFKIFLWETVPHSSICNSQYGMEIKIDKVSSIPSTSCSVNSPLQGQLEKTGIIKLHVRLNMWKWNDNGNHFISKRRPGPVWFGWRGTFIGSHTSNTTEVMFTLPDSA